MDKQFNHEALLQEGNRPLVYTAMSKHYFYFRMLISKYVLQEGAVPLNPFMLFDYFLADSVDRNCVKDANNSIVLRADQIWVFGPISNGVLAEIMLAQRAGKPIKYFSIESPHKIVPAIYETVQMEADVLQFKNLLKFEG